MIIKLYLVFLSLIHAFVGKGSIIMDFMEDQAEESDVNSEDEGGRSDASGSGSDSRGKSKSKKKKKKSRQIISDSDEEEEEEEDGNCYLYQLQQLIILCIKCVFFTS